MTKYFRTLTGQKLKLPVFFPDATQAVIRGLDSLDIANTHTPGILVNTYHLYKNLHAQILSQHTDVRDFMSWSGGLIADSGGFQIMTLAKKFHKKSKITDEGITFKPEHEFPVILTPEISISFQMALKTDLVVCLDEYTTKEESRLQAEKTIERTIAWAKRCKKEYNKLCKKYCYTAKKRPYLLGVSQGGEYLDLREYCTKELVKIGFDGLGWGGWGFAKDGTLNYEAAKIIADNCPKNYLLYGLGVGRPENIVACADLGYTIFDCVLPTRDARHKRLYVYNAASI